MTCCAGVAMPSGAAISMSRAFVGDAAHRLGVGERDTDVWHLAPHGEEREERRLGHRNEYSSGMLADRGADAVHEAVGLPQRVSDRHVCPREARGAGK